VIHELRRACNPLPTLITRNIKPLLLGRGRNLVIAGSKLHIATGVTELPSTPKIKQQSSITNPHPETGLFHIKSMPKCGKFGAASTAGWGAGAAIFSPVGRVVLLQ
jgi:hypothetical protein